MVGIDQKAAARNCEGESVSTEEQWVVQRGREKEGGGVRVVLPLQHSGDVSKGRFLPEGGISSVLGHPELVSARDSAFRS